jgi:hypothetical protein
MLFSLAGLCACSHLSFVHEEYPPNPYCYQREFAGA